MYHFTQAAMTWPSRASTAARSVASAISFSALLALERKAPQGGRLDELGDGHPVAVISGCQEPGGCRDGHADVTHLGRADLVGRVLVRVVVAIGEVPVEQRRNAGVGERRVIAARPRTGSSARPSRSRVPAAGTPRGADRSAGCPSASPALTSPAPHSVCGSDGRAHTADGSACFSIRNVPPVFAVSSPVMSIENMYCTPFASLGCDRQPLRGCRGSRRPT